MLGPDRIRRRRPIGIGPQQVPAIVELDERFLIAKARLDCIDSREADAGEISRVLMCIEKRYTRPCHRDDAQEADADDARDNPDPGLTLPAISSPHSFYRRFRARISFAFSHDVCACRASRAAAFRSDRFSANCPISTRARPWTHCWDSPPWPVAVGLRRLRLAHERERGAALVSPEPLLAGYPPVRVGGEHCQSLAEQPFGISTPASTQRSRARFQHYQPVTRIQPAEFLQDPHGIVVLLLAVENQDKGEQRIDTIVDRRVCRRAGSSEYHGRGRRRSRRRRPSSASGTTGSRRCSGTRRR